METLPPPAPSVSPTQSVRCRASGAFDSRDSRHSSLPLTPATHHLLNADSIARLKPGAMVVNTSRGKLIDTKAVIASLKRGHLGGLAIDVYEEEEGIFFEDLSGEVLQDDELSRLLTFPNVLVTAHQAFLTREALSEIARVTVENLSRAGRGEPFLAGTRVEEAG